MPSLSVASGSGAAAADDDVDYAVTDSLHLSPSDRPCLTSALSNPRDGLALALLAAGAAVSVQNVLGSYGESYVRWEVVSAFLGLASMAAAFLQVRFQYNVSSVERRGVIDDAVVNLYGGMYSGSAAWLSFRAGPSCPAWIPSLDGAASLVAAGVFAFSLLAPAVTLLENGRGKEGGTLSRWMVDSARSLSVLPRRGVDEAAVDCSSLFRPLPNLSETELIRARGLLFIGMLGCIFVPDCIAFALGGQDWWGRVTDMHPSQGILESSTALFALYATEASMVAHRAGKAGVAPFKHVVPAFAAVCIALAVVPCVCALHWLGDDISFFSFYTE